MYNFVHIFCTNSTTFSELNANNFLWYSNSKSYCTLFNCGKEDFIQLSNCYETFLSQCFLKCIAPKKLCDANFQKLFLWNLNVYKVKKNVITQDYLSGGLKMISIYLLHASNDQCLNRGKTTFNSNQL